jgi:hypothetical protein
MSKMETVTELNSTKLCNKHNNSMLQRLEWVFLGLRIIAATKKITNFKF